MNPAFSDLTTAASRPRLKPQWTSIDHYVCFDNGEFDALLAAEDGDYAWAEGPEREPCMLCYTSGTTGNPKGVLYSHRSTVLHSFAVCAADGMALSSKSSGKTRKLSPAGSRGRRATALNRSSFSLKDGADGPHRYRYPSCVSGGVR